MCNTCKQYRQKRRKRWRLQKSNIWPVPFHLPLSRQFGSLDKNGHIFLFDLRDNKIVARCSEGNYRMEIGRSGDALEQHLRLSTDVA